MLRHVFLLNAILFSLVCSPVVAQDRLVPSNQAEIQLSFAPIVKSAAPSVVNVYATRITQETRSVFNDPFFERFFGSDNPFAERRARRSQSLGSGVIVGQKGIILTNHHVVEGASDIRISLANGREYQTDLVLADEKTDLAVLQVKNGPEGGFPTLRFSKNDELEVGDLVLAIGNPFGVGQTVTSGIVSAKARTGVGVSDFQFFIQTDAAINPGNSGGALVNMRGELVGINTAIYSRSGGSNGIGFAIPARMASFVVRSALENGEIVRPWFGARLQTVSDDLAQSLLLDSPRGALITDIYPDSPADRAGLKSGDVILKINSRLIEDPGGFDYRFSTQELGKVVQLGVARGGDRVEIDLELTPYPAAETDQLLLEKAGRFSGALVRNIGPMVIEDFDLPYNFSGVIVSAVANGSPAQRLGLRVGDVILELNGTQITDAAQMEKIVQQRVGGWRLKIRRGNQLINSFVNG